MSAPTKTETFAAVLKRWGMAFVLFTTVLSTGCPVGAADAAAPALKAISPQIDPSADRKPEARRPLQATVEMTEQYQKPKTRALRGTQDGASLRSGAQADQRGFLGKLRGGSKTANIDTLKSRANNSGFNVAATAGFGIIGVKFILSLGRPPVINRVFPGTPAMVVGLQKDDAIVAVDGVPTYGLSKEEVYDLIIGSPGSKVSISIMRSGDFRVVSCVRMDINELTDPIVRRDYLMSM